MFSPSKNLLFTNLKIHHPLPLNPRESKQLLNILTTSFRRHLDAEHPAFGNPSGHPNKSGHLHRPRHGARRPSSSEASRTPVDQHMRALLTNPLFGYTAVDHETGKTLEPTARILRLFDLAVGKGMMTNDYARILLNQNKRVIISSSAIDVQECLRASQAGSKVLKWLTSSGGINDLEFPRDEAFTAILIEHLVAEDLQEVVWSWIKRSLSKLPELSAKAPLTPQDRRAVVTPLLQLVMAESRNLRSLDKAYMCLSRAAGYLQGMSASVMVKALYPPGRFLFHETIYSHSARAASSASDFESFLSLVPVMFPSGKIPLYTAHLNLFHPTTPQPGPAMHFLKNLPNLSRAETQGVVQLGLDTAKYLLENDRVNDALDIMDILRVRFPKQVGVSQRRQMEEVKAEASTMELLDGLSLA